MRLTSLKSIVKILLVSSLLLLLSISSIGVTYAQDEVNLLTNPGFESPYENRGGEPVRQVAQGWSPWHMQPTATMSSGENAQPAYAPAAPDASRIRSGNNAQSYFNNDWRSHDAGVFQRVTGVTPGTEYRFSVYAWVWSSSFDDVSKSEEAGDVTVQVGIDPTGGTDPTSSNIVWSVAVSQYDAYRQYTSFATATSNAITVYVRSRGGFPVQYTYTYLDDAVLAASVSDVEPTDPPEPTDEPEPTDTPIPTNTPEPTEDTTAGEDPTPTREVDATVVDAATAVPTNTPMPTNTSVPTAIGNTGNTDDSNFPNTLLYTVRRGDTVGRLAVLYGSTIEAIARANDLNEAMIIYIGQGLLIPVPLAAPATSTPTATPQTIVVTATPNVGAVPATYTIQAGDTLYRIALRFNTTVATLAQVNGIVNPNLIRSGQVITIPGGVAVGGATATQTPVEILPTQVPVVNVPTTYVIQPGDNLYRISLRFGVTMLAIADANGIINVNRLYAGQTLIIP